MTGSNPDPDRQQAALTDLERLRNERDMFSTLFRSAAWHFGAADTPNDDAIERWGRRIGRGLAAVAFVGFCLYLYLAYVR